MPEFKDMLMMLRKRNRLTQNDLGALLGMSGSSISMYERGERIPSKEALETIADHFNVPIDYLLGRDVEQALPNNIISAPSISSIRIPVLGRIPAGIPLEAIEDVIDWEEIPQSMLSGEKEYFALQVKGDSMWPDYLPGDVVIVRRQPCCDSGDIAVVYIDGCDATLKQVRKNDEDGTLTIIPKNPNYPPRTFTTEEVSELPVTVAGVVVELRRKIK